MSDVIYLAAGLTVGLLLGSLLAGVWITGRLRAQAQRAEATTDELRKQLDRERQEGALSRQALAEAQHAQTVAETRI
ncbi:MAG: hypothetical protein OEW25_09880, partial [Nitrospira sp.]|nr:hypothetical protein [Nitrospira sp.]